MTSEKKDSGEIGSRPAFPLSDASFGAKLNGDLCYGMDIRTYLAGQALAGVVAQIPSDDPLLSEGIEVIAKGAASASVLIADALLARLQETSDE